MHTDTPMCTSTHAHTHTQIALLALGTVNQQNSQLFSSESGQSKTLFKENLFLKMEAIVKHLTWLEFFKEIPI